MKDDKLIEQEIIKVLGENGIPTDVDYFLSQAQSFLQDSTNIFSGKKNKHNESINQTQIISK